MGMGWKAPLPPTFILRFQKALAVVMTREAQGVVLGHGTLHQNTPGFSRTSCTPRDLSDQLKRAFCGAKIWNAEALLRQQNTNQCDVRKIMTFRYHLCPNKHIDGTGSKVVEQLIQCMSSGRIPVHASDRGMLKNRCKLGFYRLRTCSYFLQVF